MVKAALPLPEAGATTNRLPSAATATDCILFDFVYPVAAVAHGFQVTPLSVE